MSGTSSVRAAHEARQERGLGRAARRCRRGRCSRAARSRTLYTSTMRRSRPHVPSRNAGHGHPGPSPPPPDAPFHLQPAEPAQRRTHLEHARCGEVAKPPARPEHVEPAFADGGLELGERLVDRPRRAAQPQARLCDCPHLRVLDDLLDSAQVELGLVAEPDRRPPRVGLHARSQAGRAQHAARSGGHAAVGLGLRRRSAGDASGDVFGRGRRVARRVLVQHQHRVRHVEVVSRPSNHEDGRDAPLGPEGAHARDEGADRLAVRADQSLHARVADHEVGRARVLVEQQRRGAALERLDDGGGLRG
mmetsp:Transcript_821/g.2661  ORF Transcript_821/g.2661 Transcript_821/m.2661 type:complete len:305 (-) Transcript_821:1352-2266(-)